MKTNKIRKIVLKGFRGSRGNLEIDFKNNSSLLLYGNNATGKSTITDSIEWFLYDKISPLKGEGILKNEGIRNKDLAEKETSQVTIEFSDSFLNSTKKLMIKNKNHISEYSNKENNFKDYLDSIPLENLLIRNDELINFIISTKSKRFSDISNLIGYSQVKKIKDTLKQSVSGLNNLIRSRDFEDRERRTQEDLIQYTKANIHSEEQFFSSIDNLCKNLKLGFKIDSWESFGKLEKETSKIKLDPKLQFKDRIVKILSCIGKNSLILKALCKNLKQFQISFKKISEDRIKLKGVKIKSLLKDAEHIISSKVLDKKDQCPLCLQNISHDELLESIVRRLDELKNLEKEMLDLDQIKCNINDQIEEIGEFFRDINRIEYSENQDFNDLKTKLNEFLPYLREIDKLSSSELNFDDDTHYDECINKITSFSLENIKKTLETLNSSIKESQDLTPTSDIKIAKKSFLDIKRLQEEKEELKSQERTLKQLYQSFAKYQKEEMELFLSSISSEMNTFFQFMYPHDNIKNIQLTLQYDSEEDIVGIDYPLDFRGTQLNTPKKCLSESYLNCLGLCLFLSSVKLFNKRNKFFVLDDVISSFDKNHRLLFANLLVEKFSNWQIIVLTHEDEWFKYLSSLVKSKDWIIKEVKWNNQIGSYLDEKTNDLESNIEKQIQKQDPEGLGNKMGRYLESLLKDICENLGANVAFKRREKNEERTIDELRKALI